MRREKQVHVIWHDDKFIERVPLPVDVMQRIANDAGTVGLSEHARTVSRIEPAMQFRGKTCMIFVSFFFRKQFDFFMVPQSVSLDPRIALGCVLS